MGVRGVNEASILAAAITGVKNGIATNPDRKFPPLPPRTIITAFQTGHGWTQTGNGSSNLNDSATFIAGSQSIRGTTDGANTYCNLNSPTLTPIDLTGKLLVIRLRVSDPTHLSQIVVYAANDSGMSNSAGFVFTSGSGGDELLRAGEWVTVTLPFDAPTCYYAGTFVRSAVTNFRIGLRDTGAGTMTVNIQELSIIDEPTDLWPTGLVSFDFDDAYASHYTVAAPYLARYGWAGTSYPIVDAVDTANFMTTEQVKALQDTYGWTVGMHAATAAHHDAGLTTLTASEQVTEIAACRSWLKSNGLRGGDFMAYPRGMFDANLRAHIVETAASARTTYRRYRESWPPAEPYMMRAISVLSSDSLANLQAEIDAAAKGKYWLILVFHDLVTSGATGNQWTRSNFQSLVDYAATTGIRVHSIQQALDARRIKDADFGGLERDLASGQETFPRALATTQVGLGSGALRLTYFTARKTEACGAVRVNTGSTVPGTITLSRVGVYEVAANGDLTLIGSSANDTTFMSAASTTYTKALSSAIRLRAGKRYAIGLISVQSTGNAPGVMGIQHGNAAEAAIAPRLTASLSGQSDLPSSISAGSLQTTVIAAYAATRPY